MMRKQFWAVLAAGAVAAVAVAQNLPAIRVSVRTGGAVTAGASTNAAPTLCTTNVPGFTRAWLLIQNTNATGTVMVYAGTNTAAPLAEIPAAGGTWVTEYPVVDNGQYSVRSTGAARAVLVSEGWGQ
jgi:hypothetical protein